MPWKPSELGERPTLGYLVLDWIIENLAAPDSPTLYAPLIPSREQAEFILAFYEVDPHTCKRVVRRGVISRPRGWGKSPFVAAIAWVEALGPVVPDGWDADGRPVGKPWATVRTPLVQLAAVSEAQVGNSWLPLVEMAEGPVVDNYPGVEPMRDSIMLPNGHMAPITASPRTVKGAKPVFAILDQTEEWVAGNSGPQLAKTMRDNASKINGTTIETPNAFTPGEGSVAEATANAAKLMDDGKRDESNTGLLYDHREAPADTDIADPESLRQGLRVAYGDSADDLDGCLLHDPPCGPGWSPISRMLADVNDPDLDVQSFRGNFLNQITHASNSFLSSPAWKGCEALDLKPQPRDTITLGFDGSRGRAKGKPDATALVACRVSDGFIWPVKIWEAADHPADSWADWEPPIPEIEATIRDLFANYRVAGFYCDPAKDWRSFVGAWEASYGEKVAIKATASHPFEWWMSGGSAGKAQQAIEAFEGAVRNQDLCHNGDVTLLRHVLNARRRIVHKKLALAKENDYSPNKIDGCVAAVLAYQARVDAIAAGVLTRSHQYQTKLKRLR